MGPLAIHTRRRIVHIHCPKIGINYDRLALTGILVAEAAETSRKATHNPLVHQPRLFAERRSGLAIGPDTARFKHFAVQRERDRQVLE
jgi:hypothetical protein